MVPLEPVPYCSAPPTKVALRCGRQPQINMLTNIYLYFVHLFGIEIVAFSSYGDYLCIIFKQINKHLFEVSYYSSTIKKSLGCYQMEYGKRDGIFFSELMHFAKKGAFLSIEALNIQQMSKLIGF